MRICPDANSTAASATRPPTVRRPCRAGSIEDRPDERPCDEPAGVLEVVQLRMAERGVVERGDVPDREVQRPERERRPPAASATCEERADAAAPRERPEHRAPAAGRTTQRPAHRDDEQRRRDVADQHVLRHVRREQAVVREPVERREERDERHGEPEREERDAVPAGEVGAAARTEPQTALPEERRRRPQLRRPGASPDSCPFRPRRRGGARSPCAAPRSCPRRSRGSSGRGRAARSRTRP